MGQCCSANNRTSSKKRPSRRPQIGSSSTLHNSYYEDNYITAVPQNQPVFQAPSVPGTREQTPNQLVNRDVYDAVSSHFCSCSNTPRCAHRPLVAPRRRSEPLRWRSTRLHSGTPRARRVTADHVLVGRNTNLPYPEPRQISDISSCYPLHSSSLIADQHDSSCTIHGLHLSVNNSSRAGQGEVTILDSLPSFDDGTTSSLDERDTSTDSLEEEGVFGYKFVPNMSGLAFEQSIIAWV